MSALLKANDTIVAQATPPGRGGIAVVRVSGPLVTSIIQQVFNRSLPPREAIFLPFLDENRQMLDEGLGLYFPAPRSFTGEDVLELHGHGGPVIVDMLLQRLLALGARLARPGEFSERAFLNGKMDLTQVEAVADLIDASSKQAARLAVRSLQGDFSRDIQSLLEQLIHLRVYIEAAIDFSDEEIDFMSDDRLAVSFATVIDSITTIQNNAKQGSLLRDGMTVVIVGEPNVGKSSLLNRLSGRETAIVTDIPGTTRDVLRDQILMDGIPLHVVDTAGLRETQDVVELEGMRRARDAMASADVVLQLFSGETLPAVLAANTILVRNKIDLSDTKARTYQQDGYSVVALSAKTGAGIDLLTAAIKKQIGFQPSEGLYLARRRHLDALARAHAHIITAYEQFRTPGLKKTELIAEDLRLAQNALSEITGEFTADDLLGKIFSSFCIGK